MASSSTGSYHSLVSWGQDANTASLVPESVGSRLRGTKHMNSLYGAHSPQPVTHAPTTSSLFPDWPVLNAYNSAFLFSLKTAPQIRFVLPKSQQLHPQCKIQWSILISLACSKKDDLQGPLNDLHLIKL